MSTDWDLDETFERWVVAHVTDGEGPDPVAFCDGDPVRASHLGERIAAYRRVTAWLDEGPDAAAHGGSGGEDLPSFDGFRTIERVGEGGSGRVFKLFDIRLGRLVAAKVLRDDQSLTTLAGFLDEARALALFDDPRIVRVYEFRPSSLPPVLLMEFVDGFVLSRVAASLEWRQRTLVMREICEAVHQAHRLGIQHRDLKPSNVMLDAQLRPRILDFGLAGRDPHRGHFRGTPRYLAPEQLDPAAPLDERTDVYGLGTILFEMLCGVPPIEGHETSDILERVRHGTIRLPADVNAMVPEPLQAIALKALERDPSLRYATARDMALDLQRVLDERPVEARPTRYAAALGARVSTHLAHVQDWLRLNLIYPHEAWQLRRAYGALLRRDDDWIGESRVLSYSQIVLYLGAFLLFCGSLFYFGVHRVHGAVTGLIWPITVLGIPFVGLNTAAHLLDHRDRRAVAVACYLGGAVVLPLFLVISFFELGWWNVAPDVPGQLFVDGIVSNRQLQATILCSGAWTAWLATRTRTLALSTLTTALTLCFVLACLADFGLREWIDDGRWDYLALHLLPAAPLFAGVGVWLDRTAGSWFGRPYVTGAGLLLIVSLELLALDARELGYLGISLSGWQPDGVSDPILLDTLAALSINGGVFYVVGSALERRRTDLARPASWMLLSLAPFAMLEPLARLSSTGEYTRGVDWAYLVLAVLIALASHRRQRRSFYYAGLLNTGVALYLLADHSHWFDRPAWAVALVLVGVAALALGFGLDRRDPRAGPQQTNRSA